MIKMATNSLEEIKKILKTNKLVIGSDRTLKNLKKGDVSKVFLSSNCAHNLEKDIKGYCRISKTDVAVLDKTNEELGVICKKPFSISVLSIKK